MCPGAGYFTKHTSEDGGSMSTSFFDVLSIATPLILLVPTPAGWEKHCQV